MRQGNLSLTLIPQKGPSFQENPDGTVSARANTVYTIQITNHGPRRALVTVKIDGELISGTGLVINGNSTLDLERSVEGDSGCFTVFPEGAEDVFGEDGGRTNPDLGLIEVTHQMELVTILPYYQPFYTYYNYYPPRYISGPYWEHDWRVIGATNSSLGRVMGDADTPSIRVGLAQTMGDMQGNTAQINTSASGEPQTTYTNAAQNAMAAGTGLTGHSNQSFVPTTIGALESFVTTIMLRLILSSNQDWSKPRPLSRRGMQKSNRPEPRP